MYQVRAYGRHVVDDWRVEVAHPAAHDSSFAAQRHPAQSTDAELGPFGDTSWWKEAIQSILPHQVAPAGGCRWSCMGQPDYLAALHKSVNSTTNAVCAILGCWWGGEDIDYHLSDLSLAATHPRQLAGKHTNTTSNWLPQQAWLSSSLAFTRVLCERLGILALNYVASFVNSSF